MERNIWYCGHCGHGPLSLTVDTYCPICHRILDGYASVHHHQRYPKNTPAVSTQLAAKEGRVNKCISSPKPPKPPDDFPPCLDVLENSDLVQTGPSLEFAEHFFQQDRPKNQQWVPYSRTRYPGESSYSLATGDPATAPPRRAYSPVRRAEVAYTRSHGGACPECKKKKKACRHGLIDSDSTDTAAIPKTQHITSGTETSKSFQWKIGLGTIKSVKQSLKKTFSGALPLHNTEQYEGIQSPVGDAKKTCRAENAAFSSEERPICVFSERSRSLRSAQSPIAISEPGGYTSPNRPSKCKEPPGTYKQKQFSSTTQSITTTEEGTEHPHSSAPNVTSPEHLDDFDVFEAFTYINELHPSESPPLSKVMLSPRDGSMSSTSNATTPSEWDAGTDFSSPSAALSPASSVSPSCGTSTPTKWGTGTSVTSPLSQDHLRARKQGIVAKRRDERETAWIKK